MTSDNETTTPRNDGLAMLRELHAKADAILERLENLEGDREFTAERLHQMEKHAATFAKNIATTNQRLSSVVGKVDSLRALPVR